MAFCTQCGTKNDANAKFCCNCGEIMQMATAASISYADMDENIIGKTCPYCQTPLKKGATVVLCQKCGMPHHQTCWIENGNRCTTFGCTGSTSISDETDIHQTVSCLSDHRGSSIQTAYVNNSAENYVVSEPVLNSNVSSNVSAASIDGMSKFVLLSCCVAILLSAVVGFLSVSMETTVSTLSRGIKTNLSTFQSSAESLDQLIAWVAIFKIGSHIFFLIWIYKSYKALQKFYPIREIKFTPGWAVGWFFIPFANLFKPFGVITELFGKCQPLNSNHQFKYVKLTTFIWWLLFLLSYAFDRSTASSAKTLISSKGAAALTNMQYYLQALTINEVISIAATVMMAFIVYKISYMLAVKQLCENVSASNLE